MGSLWGSLWDPESQMDSETTKLCQVDSIDVDTREDEELSGVG